MTETATHEVKENLDFKRVFPIFLIVLIDLLGLTIIIPLLPLYTVAMGAAPFIIGVLGATYPMMQLIGGPLLGGLSDRYGRKPIFLISQIGTFVGFIILGFANTLLLIFLSRLIDGISGANLVVAQAAITDSTTAKTRTQGLGLIGAAFGLGFTIGPAIAGITLSLTNNNYQIPAFLAAGFSLLSLLLTQFWFKETLTDEIRQKQQSDKNKKSFFATVTQAISTPVVAILLLLMFAQQLAFYGYENLFPLFTLHRLGLNAAGNAILFVFIGILLVMVQGRAIGPLSRKYGERTLIIAGLTLLGIGLILSAITPSIALPGYSQKVLLEELGQQTSQQSFAVTIPDGSQIGWLGIGWLLIASIPATIGAGMLAPSINSLITKQVPADQAGTTLGVSAAFVSGANAITPILGGAMFQFLGSTSPFLIGGLLLLLLLIPAVTRIPLDAAENSLTPHTGIVRH
jgi:MFS transporter, DHA1 family, tetracycline resistance protein